MGGDRISVWDEIVYSNLCQKIEISTFTPMKICLSKFTKEPRLKNKLFKKLNTNQDQISNVKIAKKIMNENGKQNILTF